MMKQLWALPALMRLVLASPGSFSVLDDLLAFPQYQIRFSDGSISDEHAKSLYLSSKAADTPNGAISNVDVSQQPRQDDGVPVGATDPFRSSHQGEQDHDDELSATYERLVLHSRPYLCRIPIVDTAGNRSPGNVTQSAADEEEELFRATDRGWELLKGMQGNCIYFLSGWWSYSFCYNEGVKQFHQLPPSRGVPIYPPVEDESVGSYILGRFPDDGKIKGKVESEADDANVDDEVNSKDVKKDGEETAVARMETKGESRYLVQKLTGGTTCDLTGKERKIEVQFHCHPNTPDRIGMIKEVATCSYLMVIYTPRLCNDVAFLPPQENRAHAISCAPIASPGSPPGATLPSATYHHRAESAVEKAHKPETKEASIRLPPALAAAASGPQATSRPLPTVGGTVVGAKQLVGQPGSRIEKSVVVGGGKETMLGTVASSDGRGKEKVMTPEQLRKLDIKDPRDVDDLKKELGKMAGNRAWRLILIDTPHGREFRGIIDTDDDDDDGDNKASRKSKDKSREKDDADAKKNRNDGERSPRPESEGDEDEWEWEFEEWFEWGEGEDEPDREMDNEGSQEEFYREDL